MDLGELAHRVYWAITQRVVSLDDNSDKLTMIQYDEMEIDNLTQRNMLGIGLVKLFVIKTQNANWYAFYLSKSSLEAHSLHSRLFRENPVSISSAERLMTPLMTFAETGEEMNLYEYRKSLIDFPAYIGHAEAGRHVFYKMKGATA